MRFVHVPLVFPYFAIITKYNLYDWKFHTIQYSGSDSNMMLLSCTALRLASQVLLATLAIPIVPVTSESTRFLQHDNFVHEKDRRLASLLRLSVTPTRHSLHKDLVSV